MKRAITSLLCAAMGCASDHPGGAVLGANGTSDAGGGSLGDAAVLGSPGEPGICNPIVQESEVVAELGFRGAAEAPTGGTIVPGTYVLNELRAYVADAGHASDPGAPAPTGRYARATMVVTTRSIRTLRSEGQNPDALPADTLGVVLYAVGDTTLASTSTCTSSVTHASGMYSADANYITLFPAPGQVEVFVLRAYATAQDPSDD